MICIYESFQVSCVCKEEGEEEEFSWKLIIIIIIHSNKLLGATKRNLNSKPFYSIISTHAIHKLQLL